MAEAPLYTKHQLEQLLAGAIRLGFRDDIAHWTKLLKELKEN